MLSKQRQRMRCKPLLYTNYGIHALNESATHRAEPKACASPFLLQKAQLRPTAVAAARRAYRVAGVRVPRTSLCVRITGVSDPRGGGGE